MLWLKNLRDCPPGEFYYRQPEAGSRTFGPSPLISTVAADLGSFRKANNLPRHREFECAIDIVQFTVNRLDPRSEWIIDIDSTPEQLIQPTQSGKCGACGATVT